jgi:alpha-L-fucosidase
MSWFHNAGLGIFIHFGHASSRGWELSWQMSGGVVGQYPPREPVGCEEYFANAQYFDPARFDANDWADQIAATGASYAVVTAKHHDGFALWDSKVSDYSITRTSVFGRDLLAELLPALRHRGLRVGIYFSLCDWYHEDYPRYSDATLTKPYELGSWVRTDLRTWGRFRSFLTAQLSELLTEYGPVDLVWFDGEFEHTTEEWDFADLRQLVRDLQPDALVNDRCVGYGDFATPEQQLIDSGSVGDRPWELCLTMNDSWGWVPEDHAWKSTADLIGRLVETVTRGGNLLLNVGPMGDGRFPEPAADRLSAIGGWIQRNRAAASGLTPWPDPATSRLPMATQRLGDRTSLYCYLTLRPYDSLLLQGLPVRRLRSIRILETGQELRFTAVPRLPDVHAGLPDPLGEVVVELSTSLDELLIPVLVAEFDGELSTPPSPEHQASAAEVSRRSNHG